MKDTVLKISLAALFHDIGKFAQEALALPAGYQENNADLYQPFRDGHHTHTHALYTAAFIEKYKSLMPKELNSPDWGEGEREDSFINLAAKHHKPGTALQLIITQADRLSSGFDRAEFQEGEEIGVREYRQTRLLPIFERLLREDKKFDKPGDFEWRYPLAPISAQNIFPIELKELKKEEAKEEYRRLFENFEKDLSSLCHKNHVELWAQHFDSLLRIYTSHIPAARVGKVIHDVSLYDHLRTTAALAGALYLYHRETESLNEKAITDDIAKKFLLVSGDFYGIQNFIFRGGGEERHHRAKLLRGRSFLVSLIMELAAEIVCEKTGLSFLSVFFSAAGKFHLLAPNTESARKAINEAREEINNWLYENFFGECAIGFAVTEASPSEFTGGNFIKLWQRHLDNLEEAKFNRLELAQYGGVFKDYLDSFDNELPKAICPLCDTRPSTQEVLNDDYIKRRGQEEACACKLCRDQAFLGTKLVKGERLAVIKGDEGDLKEPLFALYQIKFLNGCAKELADKKKLIRLYDLNVKEGKAPVGVTFLPINGYVPVFKEEDQYFDCLLAGQKQEQKYEELIEDIKEERPKSFYHLAQKALRAEFVNQKIKCYGLPALGVLKADVDNLGAIFGCGLPGKLFTISRLATMSRQLNNFFTIYLPYALEYEKNGRFQDIYTVFAGGDDFFLIGPWNRIRELALFLWEKFAVYVCENPKLHFSAGITLHKPHVPVDLMAEEAEEALNFAKKEPKDQVSMFGQVVSWREFEKLFEIEQTLTNWYRENIFTRRGLYRLNELAALAHEEARFLSVAAIPWHRLQCAKWPAYLRYFLVRMVERQVKENREQTYEDLVSKLYTWLAKYRGSFVLALWPLLYKTRKQRL